MYHPVFQPGDLIGFSGFDPPSIVVNVATLGIPGRDLTHVGQLIEWRGKLALAESTGLCGLPCLYHEVPVFGVQFHPLADRVRTYRGRVWHYPLTKLGRRDFDPRALRRFWWRHRNAGYDLTQAIDSRDLAFGWLIRRFGREHLEHLYCSEAVAAGWRESRAWKIANASVWSPRRLEREAQVTQGIIGPRRRLVHIENIGLCYAGGS